MTTYLYESTYRMSSFLCNKLDTTGSPIYTPIGNKTNNLPPVVRFGGDTPGGDMV